MVAGLVKQYGGVRALDGVSLTVAPGQVVGLLGPNGAGKTTLVECLLGLRQPDQGQVLAQSVGALLQSTALQDSITCGEALDLFARFYPRPLPVEGLLERFGLKAESRFSALSGGQRQRLGLALALVGDPAALVLDEPTANLDSQGRRELHHLIRASRDEGRAVLLTTHFLEEAESLCDRVAILHRGRLVAEGAPAELVARSNRPTRLTVRYKVPGQPELNQEQHRLASNQTGPAVVELVKELVASGRELVDLQVERPSLEDLLLELTGS
ncbi:ABC transporter ATP-binding protein [bacterium]|nr:ABC transporter ATP-binding protein [bacterium]